VRIAQDGPRVMEVVILLPVHATVVTSEEMEANVCHKSSYAIRFDLDISIRVYN